MSTTSQSLIWASIIIAAALLSKSLGLSDAASFGMISGLVGAAYGTIMGKSSCRKGCA